jgi:hypothetical protein
MFNNKTVIKHDKTLCRVIKHDQNTLIRDLEEKKEKVTIPAQIK